MRHELYDILGRMEAAAAAQRDENTIALIHRTKFMFDNLPAYLHEDKAQVTHRNLEGTFVPANLANQTTYRDTNATVQAYAQGTAERQELADLDESRDDIGDDGRARQLR